MGAVRMRLRADLRERWRSWVGLALLAGLAGGLVIAAAAGARRTQSAYPRLLARSNPADVIVYNYQDPGLAVLDPEQIEALPHVAEAVRGNLFYVTSSAAPGGVVAVAVDDERFGTTIDGARIIAGRRADPHAAGEVTISYAGAEAYNLTIGDTFPLIPSEGSLELSHVSTAERERLLAFVRGLRPPLIAAGVPEVLRIVGIQVGPGDLPPITTGSSLVVYGTPALHDVLSRVDLADSEQDSLLIRLKRGEADIEAFNEAVSGLAGDRGYTQLLRRSDNTAIVQRAIGPLSSALWLLAGLLGVVASLVLGQASARQVLVSSDDASALRAVGMTPIQLWAVAVTRSAATGALGAVVAVVAAVALSPLTPLGIARVAEPDPGFRLDASVLGAGALSIVVALALLAALPAWRAANAHHADVGAGAGGAARPSATAVVLSRLGAGTAVVAGAHLALTPGRGRTSVPVRTTLIGVGIAVAALAAALGIGASLRHLLVTPRVYGQTWDRTINTYGEDDVAPGALAVKDDPGLTAISYGDGGEIEIEGNQLEFLALTPLKGDAYPPIIEGSRPTRADEIALGIRTMRTLGVKLGDRVRVGFDEGEAPRSMRIVARVVTPAPTSSKLGEFAYLDYEAIRPRQGAEDTAGVIVMRFAPGADQTATLIRVSKACCTADTLAFTGVEGFALRGEAPVDVVNFGRVEDLPIFLGGAFAVLAAAVLGHMVSASVRRRRRDLAILKTLGLGRRQIRAAVGWQATLLVLVALAVGIPVGIIGGRWAWTALANGVGVLPEPRVPLGAVLTIVPAAVLLANLVAALPGRIAARTQPAIVLRSE